MVRAYELQEDHSVLTDPWIVFNGFRWESFLAMLYTKKKHKK